MKVYHVTQVLKQGINTKTMCPNYILEIKKHEVVFIASLYRRVGQHVIEHYVCSIVGHCYYSFLALS